MASDLCLEMRTRV